MGQMSTDRKGLWQAEREVFIYPLQEEDSLFLL